jgi:molybdate transport system ATP-binding protein
MPEPITLPRVRHRLVEGLEVEMGPVDLEPGERLVMFGPNGAGKTTALRLLAGTLGAGSGLPHSAYLPQHPYMFRGSARHNLGLGLNAEELAGAQDMAGELGLGDKLDDAAQSLSGGERQRLALARTLAHSADLVLLDEPLSAIDLRDRDLVTSVLIRALGERSAVIVTHDREVVAALADRVAVMVSGAVRQIGSVDEVFTLPSSDEVALSVGIGNVLSGVVVDLDDPLVAVEVDGLNVWALGAQTRGAAVKVLFGAETVTVHTGGGSPTSARNVWEGRISGVRPVGRLVELLVDVGPTVVALITPGSLDALELHQGSPVSLSLKATAARAVAAPES